MLDAGSRTSAISSTNDAALATGAGHGDPATIAADGVAGEDTNDAALVTGAGHAALATIAAKAAAGGVTNDATLFTGVQCGALGRRKAFSKAAPNDILTNFDNPLHARADK